MTGRGQIYWYDFGPVVSSAPAKHRPVVVIQTDGYNCSGLRTTIVASLTSNTALATLPGNVLLPAAATGLPQDSVLNVTALSTIPQDGLPEGPVGEVPGYLMTEVDQGLRRVLGL